MQFFLTLWQLVLKELRSLLGDTVMVLLIVVMFGIVPFVIHEGVKAEVDNATVGVIDDDRSALSYRLRAALLPPYFKSVEEVERHRADSQMERGEFIFLLDIPPNFEKDLIAGRNPKIQVAIDATAMTIAAGGANYIEQIFRQEIAEYFHIQNNALPYEVVIRTHYNANGDSSWYSTVMQIVNNLAMLPVILVGAAVIREREHGTLEHLLVMPIDARQIALAKIIANGAVILSAAVLSMYNKLVKRLLFALLAIYVVSPADLAPGPIDDILAILIYFAANRQNLGIARKDTDVEVIDSKGEEI